MFRQFRKIEKGEFILVAVDTCSGGGDYTTAQFLSKTKIDVPLVFQSKTTTADFIPLLVRTLEQIFEITGIKPVVAFERQNGGSFLMERVAAMNMLGKFEVFIMPTFGVLDSGEGKKMGWDTNTATRPKMLQDLQGAINNQLIRIYDRQTLNECLSFIIVKTSSSWKAQAEKKAHDDLVMALAIVWQMYQLCEPAKSAKKDYSKYEHYEQPKVYDKRGYLI